MSLYDNFLAVTNRVAGADDEEGDEVGLVVGIRCTQWMGGVAGEGFAGPSAGFYREAKGLGAQTAGIANRWRLVNKLMVFNTMGAEYAFAGQRQPRSDSRSRRCRGDDTPSAVRPPSACVC